MSSWKPSDDREWLLERGIAYEHSLSYDESKPMGSWGRSQIGAIVKAHLVNLGAAMIDLAPQAIDWIDRAFAREEDLGPDRLAWYGTLNEAKAMAQWMLEGKNPASTWSLAFEERLAARQRYADEKLTAKDRNTLLDDVVAIGLQAGRYEEAMAYHDTLAGGPPKGKVSSIKAPRQLAYALCQRALGHSSGSDAELVQAGHRVLREHLAERWLHNGQYLRSAMWLKIVYELAQPELSPAEVLLKAYDDMPTIPRPAFLSAA